MYLFQAFFWDGNFCSQIINAWRNKKFNLISSLEIVEELINTFKNFKIRLPEDIIQEWKNLIMENSVFVNPKIKLNIARHNEDNKFIKGNAEYIISQDKHLIEINEYKQIKILKPEEFLKIINK